jgi:hypothetical protein
MYRFLRKLLFVNINKRVIRVATTIARKAPRKGGGEQSIEEKRNKAWQALPRRFRETRLIWLNPGHPGLNSSSQWSNVTPIRNLPTACVQG